jgi:hypothetical protein
LPEIQNLYSKSHPLADIATIRLPSRSQASDAFVGNSATASGWGKSSDGKSLKSHINLLYHDHQYHSIFSEKN